MNTATPSGQSAAKPVVLTGDELAAIAESLPSAMTALGGFHGKGKTDPRPAADSGGSTVVITMDDQGQIHVVVIVQVGPHDFEIVSDEVLEVVPA
jgi:hypothetical protein